MSDKTPKSKPKDENSRIQYPDWNIMVSDAIDNYFLKHEVKRLMKTNDSLEWRAQLAYSFGWGDCKGGQKFDSTFCINNVEIDQERGDFLGDVFNFDDLDEDPEE